MAEQNSIFGLNFNPELQDNEEDFKKALLGQAPTTPVEAGNNFLNMAGLPIVGQQPLGPASPILPSGEKAVYAMTPEELAARQAARGGSGQDVSNSRLASIIDTLLYGSKDMRNAPNLYEATQTGTTRLLGGAGEYLTSEERPGFVESVNQEILESLPEPTMEAVTQPAISTPDLGSEVAANTVMAAPESVTLDPTSDEAILARRAAREAAAREAMAAQPRLTTVGGASLSEFLGGEAMPEQGFARAEREMAGRGITLTPEQFNELSAQREARIGGGGGTATERDTRRAEARVTSSQNIPRDVREAMNTPAGRLTRDQIKRLTDWQGSAQGQAYMAEQEAAESQSPLTFDQKLAQDKFDFDVAKFSFEQEKEASDAATALRKSEEAAKYAVRDTLRQNENVMRKAQRAGQNIGFTTTGATGALLGMIPGTGAYDQKATVETLQADAAFSTLQRMRDASKTGGALGNVSERELDLLMGAVGNLKIGQSEEQFRNNLAEYVNLRNEALLNIYDAFVADYSQEAANEAFKVSSREDLIPSGTGSSQSGGTPVETQSGRYEVTAL